MTDSGAGHFVYLGQLTGHNGWVTALATPTVDLKNDRLVSASRDKTLLIWDLARGADGSVTGTPKRSLVGHSNFVQDVVISSDAQFALSSSWDCTMRLWDLSNGQTTRKFVSHEKDVMSVAFSGDNRQIVSGSRDQKLKVWNTLGECKYTITEDGHTDWVSCVRFSPNTQTPLILSASWDKAVKVWNLANLKLMTCSPDGSLCASGGKDGSAMLWDLQKGEHLYRLESNDIIHGLAFSPNRYWLCAATENNVKIWDLESKSVVAELNPELPQMSKKAMKPECISLQWSSDGSTLFTGYTDNVIRIWGVN
eukprot:NODE_962_length_1201_cov_841.625000_g680_i1.p1 GENE.NODE_962_length_1201_cov_841.625000_g680_i1~~NODE_962_length_1201_cov_841.625000_g680_i1.p1  ORF type:complete len:328 (-),score=105.75 NODE_962_length_1201_cov_841.625000_g680_i1:216-1142(-)